MPERRAPVQGSTPGTSPTDEVVEAAAERFRDLTGWSMSEGDAVFHAFIAGVEWRERCSGSTEQEST